MSVLTPTDDHSITVRAGSGGSTAVERVPALLVVGGATKATPPAERFIEFDDQLHLGRHAPAAPGAAWVVRDDLISKQHGLIERDERGFVLRDLGSRNGTTVDGARVEGPLRLRDGAVICVGAHVAVFRLVSPAERDAIALELSAPFGPVPTVSPRLARLCATMRRLAPSDNALLLTGETGVGKEVYAHALHQASGRRGRFVAINCAALPKDLIESELFGYVRGAHSQALAAKAGLFEEADGGTLFLDEIGDMPADLQVKMLRFLQDKELTPLGATRGRRLDVRVLAATSRTSGSSGSPGGLRPDLAMRLGPEPLQLLPLRQRIEDVGALAAHFLGDRPLRFDVMAYQALALHRWPGNVRELEKTIGHAALLCDGEVIALDHLPKTLALDAAPSAPPPDPAAAAPRPPARPAPSAAELETLLARFSGNVLRVARELDRKPALIYRWCERYGLSPDRYRVK